MDALGVLRVLEAVRVCGLTKTCKVYQASTSELYGKVEEVPQRETTPFHPYSPYAVAKQYGFWMVKEYRDAYGMFAVNGILFNHESERRGENFVTRKITLAAGRIAEGLQDHLELGNMDSLRDWGYAKPSTSTTSRNLNWNIEPLQEAAMSSMAVPVLPRCRALCRHSGAASGNLAAGRS